MTSVEDTTKTFLSIQCQLFISLCLFSPVLDRKPQRVADGGCTDQFKATLPEIHVGSGHGTLSGVEECL